MNPIPKQDENKFFELCEVIFNQKIEYSIPFGLLTGHIDIETILYTVPYIKWSQSLEQYVVEGYCVRQDNGFLYEIRDSNKEQDLKELARDCKQANLDFNLVLENGRRSLTNTSLIVQHPGYYNMYNEYIHYTDFIDQHLLPALYKKLYPDNCENKIKETLELSEYIQNRIDYTYQIFKTNKNNETIKFNRNS